LRLLSIVAKVLIFYEDIGAVGFNVGMSWRHRAPICTALTGSLWLFLAVLDENTTVLSILAFLVEDRDAVYMEFTYDLES
jgi:hypothetical protein